MDSSLREKANEVIAALSRAQRLFGAGQQPTPPPAFVMPADLEENLGGGRF